MRRNIVKSLLAVAIAVMLSAGVASADMTHVDLDLQSLGIDLSVVQDLELEIQLVDWSYQYLNDSWVRIDDIQVGNDTTDFTSGDWDGFIEDVPAGSSVVGAFIEDLAYPGNPYLQIVERSDTPATIIYKDYYGLAGSTLSFNIEVALADTDDLVISLLDPWTLDPLVAGFTPGSGDVAIIDNGGVTVVPVPGACLLGLLGFGSAGLGLRARLARSKSS